MASGQWIGRPTSDKECWAVELAHPYGTPPIVTPYEHVHAERVSVESGGVLVFTNGDIYTRSFVAAYGPNAYLTCFRRDECDCGEDDDE